MNTDRTPERFDACAPATLAHVSSSAVRPSHTRPIICFLGATLAPFVLVTVEAVLMHTVKGLADDSTGIFFIVIDLVVGAAFVWIAELPIWAGIILTILYLPAILVALFYYCLVFNGCVYGTWL